MEHYHRQQLLRYIGAVLPGHNQDEGISRYLDYGCWGIPHFTRTQSGQPVDILDRLFLKLHNCYECAKQDFGSRCHKDRGYQFQSASIDSEFELTCTNEPVNTPSACRRAICECDKEFVHAIRDGYELWNAANSVRFGEFDKEEKCKSGGVKAKFNKCCGPYPHRHPYHDYIDEKHYNCCGAKIFEATGNQKCCNAESKIVGVSDQCETPQNL